MGERYRILDEPRPSALSQLVVDPMWPLLGLMLAGAWLGWPWFVLNGFAMGSASRFKETALAVAGFLGSLVMFAVIAIGLDATHVRVDTTTARLVLLAVTLWKLTVGYLLLQKQSRSAELFAYFDGRLRSGMLVVFVAAFLVDKQVAQILGGGVVAYVLR